MNKPDPYLDWLRYRGSNGAVVVLSWRVRAGFPRPVWFYKFEGSNIAFGPFPDKIAAMFDAANQHGLSDADMDWEPIETESETSKP